ncbi:hypothetical protein LEP1GSC100_1874 [Leptospira interrogans serovar Bataviae str. UI 08561]|nr:hypothetical protein LEP1GSC100_1874 [Leptospira interrogans serovar Bataviae str. UI 08561]
MKLKVSNCGSPHFLYKIKHVNPKKQNVGTTTNLNFTAKL